ncbi:MAG: hypothetical protein OCU20_04200 [Methanophagales archaeon]|nr:hypothetical protein [Methanophagales archaeon]
MQVQAVEQEQEQEEEEEKVWEEAKEGAWVDRLRLVLVVLPRNVPARNAGMKLPRSAVCPAVL